MTTIEGFRLSPQQKHVWLSQSKSHADVYHAWCEVQLHGRVDTLRLQSAIESVVRQHEILRTLFQRFSGLDIPLQVIEDASVFAFSYHDLSEVQDVEQKSQLAKLKQDVLWGPLDVEHGPVLCCTLISLVSNRHILFLCLPALCADVITLKNLVHAIGRAYVDAPSSEDGSIDVIVQYADFAEWQNELLVTEQTKIGRNYWLNPQAPQLLAASLPFKNRVEQAQKFHVDLVTSSLEQDSPLLKRAEELVSLYKFSLPILFLTCWQVLLWRQMEQSDFMIGVAFDGRKQEDLAHAFGLFVQYLPLSCHLDGAQSFSTALIQIHEKMQEMSKRQEFFSWDMIREAGWSHTHEPFAQVCFAWNSILVDKGADLSWAIQDYDVCIDRFLLKLNCTSYPDRLCLDFHYDTTCIVRDDVQRIVDQYYTLIKSLIGNPAKPLNVVEMLSSRERLQVVEEWSTGPIRQEQADCIHHLFERQVEHTPYSNALIVGDQRLTYQETNAYANQLAHYLQSLGVGPEVRVGLFVERSTNLIIGLLGILKAGGTYVPFDPMIPQVGLAFMLQDVGVSIVLTDKVLLDRLPGSTCRILCLDSLCEELSKLSAENTVSDVWPEQLAYIIFTSGSTGQPKGVAITHASLSTYTRNIMRMLDIANPIVNYAMVSTIAADLGNTVLFPALCNGGCLHIIQQEVINDPSAFGAYFQRYGIDCLKIVPSHLKALLTINNPEKLLPRQVLILGGEATDWSFVQKIQILVPDCRIINHYGPTETTVGALTYHLSSDQLSSNNYQSAIPPLGRPLGDVQCYVLDQQMQPVTVWVPGELYIGGAGLARGYLNQPALTAKRFVPDPFSQKPGARLYRSGDRVRWLADGTLEYLGRLDEQVKVRGFRIELGEVEVVLGKHAEVQEAVVVVREEVVGDKRLVAYVVPYSGQAAPTVTTLRAYAQQQLPEYMVPSAFVLLEALPLTPNGKVDRRALPAPHVQQSGLERSYAPPTTPAQEVLVGIWQQVLRVQQVGIHDNFFELGGDSILSIQVVSRARQAGMHLTAKQLFQQPSIAQLALIVQMKQAREEHAEPEGPVPLTPIQHWFFEQKLLVPHHFNQALLLQARSRLRASWLEQGVHALVEQHGVLRLRFTPTATGWQQIYVERHVSGEPRLLQVDLGYLPKKEQQVHLEMLVQQMQEGLQIQDGPLMRIALFDLGVRQPQRLAWVVHHLVIDGVSWRILLEDLRRVYEQCREQQEVVLPVRSSTYQQWAWYLQKAVQRQEIQAQRAYWERQQERAVALGWAQKRAQEGQRWAEARTLRSSLSEVQTRALLQEVPQVYRTQITEVLVAALVLLWERWTGQRGMWVELEGHGREEPEETGIDLTRTVGWFTSLYPVVIELGVNREPGAVLKQVKEQLRQIPQHGLGYGVLRYLGGGLRDKELRPEIRFNYLGQFDQIWSQAALWEPATESSGQVRHVQNQGLYQIDIGALVAQGQLEITWTYNYALYEASAIGQLARQYIEQLQALIDHCLASKTIAYTPSDFPATDLSQHELDDLMDQLG